MSAHTGALWRYRGCAVPLNVTVFPQRNTRVPPVPGNHPFSKKSPVDFHGDSTDGPHSPWRRSGRERKRARERGGEEERKGDRREREEREKARESEGETR